MGAVVCPRNDRVKNGARSEVEDPIDAADTTVKNDFVKMGIKSGLQLANAFEETRGKGFQHSIVLASTSIVNTQPVMV